MTALWHGLAVVLAASPPTPTTTCRPVRPDAEVLAVITPSVPGLADRVTLSRAIVIEAAPFALASEARAADALNAEVGLRERRARVEQARRLLDEAERSFSELEDRAALDLLADATPLLVAGQSVERAMSDLARAHLLAGAIFVARGRVDAARQRLQRALDIDPEIAPPANLRLLGALEAVRAQSARRGRGWLVVELGQSSTTAEVFVDGRSVGQAPGRFEDIPAGRHLLRVSAPDRSSHVGTVAIESSRGTELQVNLPLDEVRSSFRHLGSRLATGDSVAKAQAQLTERAEVSRTLIAAVVPSRARDARGGLGAALVVDLEGAGRVRIDPLELDAARAALDRLATCSAPASSPTVAAAPALPRLEAPSLRISGATPVGEPVWSSPWFWAVAALATIAVAGGLAAAQGASAAPDSVAITLIPRP